MHDLTDDSRSNHGALPDDSHREGKGREGKGIGREIGHLAIPTYEAAAPQCDQEQIDDLRARLAATEIKLAAARLALAACREVREARDA